MKLSSGNPRTNVRFAIAALLLAAAAILAVLYLMQQQSLGSPQEVRKYLEQNAQLTDQQAAGVVGNLMQESNLDPDAVQSSGGAHGIAQWSNQTAVPDDLKGQLDYLINDMGAKGVLVQLQQAPDLETATRVFLNQYEKPAPGVAQADRRIENARRAMSRPI